MMGSGHAHADEGMALDCTRGRAMRRFHFDATDSTNVQARRLAAENPGELLLVTAAEQTAGRGRNGRTWHSPRGGAWLSVVWPLRGAPAAYAAASLAAAAAVRRALVDAAPELADRLRIKWPNDLLVDGRKAAGILCEQTSGGASAGALIVGVGVNADFDAAELPADLRHPATTLLAALGRSVPVEPLIDAVAARLEDSLAEFEAQALTPKLLDELRAHLAYVGERRVWMGPQGPVISIVRGLDDAGRLLLDGPDGPIACETGELVEIDPA